MTTPGELTGRFAEVVDVAADRVSAVVRELGAEGHHRDGTFFCVQAAARNTITHGVAGTIVAVSSVNARFAHRGHTAYAASKAGVEMLGRPADIADIVVFLSSPRSRWLTGQVLSADGGGSLRVEPKIHSDSDWSPAALRALVRSRA